MTEPSATLALAHERQVQTMDKIAPYYKAVAGVLVAFLTSLGSALLEDSAGGSSVTASEWITAVVAGLVVGGGVFVAPRNQYRGEGDGA